MSSGKDASRTRKLVVSLTPHPVAGHDIRALATATQEPTSYSSATSESFLCSFMLTWNPNPVTLREWHLQVTTARRAFHSSCWRCVNPLQVRIEQLAKELATRRVGLGAGQGECYRLWMRESKGWSRKGCGWQREATSRGRTRPLGRLLLNKSCACFFKRSLFL